MKNLHLSGEKLLDCIRICACMYAPNEMQFQKAYFAAHYARANGYDEPGQRIVVSSDLLCALLYGPSFDQIKVESIQRAKRGTIAGYVLVATFLMWKYPRLMGARNLGGASLNKAIRACRFIAKEHSWKYGDGSSLTPSETYIGQWWQEFRPVAHMWAAFEWNKVFPVVAQEDLLRPEGIESFLQLARFFEEFGALEILTKRGTKGMISPLNLDEIWTIPAEVKSAIRLPIDDDVASKIFHESPLAKGFRKYAASS